MAPKDKAWNLGWEAFELNDPAEYTSLANAAGEGTFYYHNGEELVDQTGIDFAQAYIDGYNQASIHHTY